MNKLSKGNYFFGSVKVGERGQIVIPAKARKIFKINPGDQILVFGDINKGLGLMKATKLKNFATKIFSTFTFKEEENFKEENGGDNDEE
ncbi:MAG: AbrB/MazE/SpoVT family DNA-binding domain-containing protein [Promethearchaeota archaeon]